MILVDSHMHIQSSKCATLPFLHGQIPGGMDRSTIEDLATGKTTESIRKSAIGRSIPLISLQTYGVDALIWLLKLKKMTVVSSADTYHVGKTFLLKMEELHAEFRPKRPYRHSSDLVMCAVVMTMDMEYAHFAGYFGLKVYNPLFQSEEDRKNDKEPVAYWYPEGGTSGIASDPGKPSDGVYPQGGETEARFNALRQKREKEGVLGSLYDANGKRTHSVPIHCRIKMAPKEETTLYEGWNKQLRHTKQAVIEGKLKLLPMFHYDPRRWQSGFNFAFEQVGPKGLYLGFKMYTSQGYRPWDPRISNLPRFYALCQDRHIPILTHCTPEGAPNHERKQFILFKHPKDTQYDEDQKAERIKLHEGQARTFSSNVDMSLPDSWLDNPPPDITKEQELILSIRREIIRNDATSMAAEDYFFEYFVSPKAWRPVLKEYPKLRLCLAHFGGMTKTGRAWGTEIIEMMKEFPNLYADISSSFSGEKFRKHFRDHMLKDHPHIVDRVLFGTDWYLILGDGADFPDYCRTAKEFLDGIDVKLWLKFTQENPYRFYRLGEQIGRIAGNIVKERGKEESQRASRIEGLEPEQSQRKAEEAKKAQKTYSDEISKQAKLIQGMAATLVH